MSVLKSNYYYIFTIANLLVYFILRYFSVYSKLLSAKFRFSMKYKVLNSVYIKRARIVVIGLHSKRRRAHLKSVRTGFYNTAEKRLRMRGAQK